MSSEQPNQPNSSNNPSTDNPTTNTDHTNNPTTGNTNNPNTDNTQPPRPRRRRVPNNDATNLANDLMSNLNGVLPQGSTARVFNSFTGMNQIFGGMMQAAGNAAPNGPNGSNGGINFGAFAPMMMQMGQNNSTNGSNDNQNSFQGGMFGFPPGMNAQMFGGMFGGNNNNNTNNNDQNNTNTNNTNNANTNNTNNTNNPNNANNPNNPFVSLGNMFQGLSGLGGINIMGMGPDGQTMNFNDLMTMMMGGAGLDRGPDPNAPASNDFIENLPLHSYSEEWYHQWVEDRVQYLMFQRQIELDEKERAGKEKEAKKGEKEEKQEDIVQDENTNNNNNNNNNSTTMNNDEQPLDSLTLPQPTVDNTNDNDVIDETNLFSQQPSTNEDVLLSPNDTNANQVQFNGDLAAYELQLREQLKEFECQICMIDFEKDDLITHLPCDHWYHYRCIEPWLKQRNTCPSCRSLADRGDRDRGTGNRVNGNNTATTSTTTTINGVPTTTNRPQATNGVYHLPIQPLAPAMRQQLQRSLGATDDANPDNNTTSPTLSSTQPSTSPPEAPQPRPVDPNPFRTSDFEFSIESFSNPTSNTTTSPSSSTQQSYVHQYQAQEHNISQSHPNVTPFEKWQPEVNTFSEFNNAKLYSSLYHD